MNNQDRSIFESKGFQHYILPISPKIAPTPAFKRISSCVEGTYNLEPKIIYSKHSEAISLFSGSQDPDSHYMLLSYFYCRTEPSHTRQEVFSEIETTNKVILFLFTSHHLRQTCIYEYRLVLSTSLSGKVKIKTGITEEWEFIITVSAKGNRKDTGQHRYQ